MNSKGKYLSSAFLLLLSSVIVKIIGAVYKIPLTAFIGAVGRGYFAAAYNLYLPLHAVIMGSLPVAMSRLVSKYNAKKDMKMLSSLRKGAGSLFVLFGVLGTAVLIVFALPYSRFISSSEKGVYTILVLAPSLFLCCVASCFRGFYEGFLDMKPTAVSQTLEALFKMIFGLLFSRLCMNYMLEMYKNEGKIFGVRLQNEKEALSFIYPFSSAAAMLGVTAGAAVSLVFLMAYDGINKPSLLKISGAEGRRELFSFSLTIMLSCAVQSVFQFLDTSTIQLTLKKIPQTVLYSVFGDSLSMSNTAGQDSVTYIWGLFCAALDFKNLVPGITMALGVCAVPAICAEVEKKEEKKAGALINSVCKYTSLLSIFLSAFIALCSRDILLFFYGSSSIDIVEGCEKLVKYFAFTAPLYSLASIAVYCVQALGKPQSSVFPYVLSGLIRCALNLILVRNERFILLGAVISGAVGYFVLFFMNTKVIKGIINFEFSLFSSILRPLFIGILSYIIGNTVYSSLNFPKNIFFKLLIEFALFTLIYCILCLILKAVDIKQLPRDLKFKNNGLNT